jgi:hypothetical protein
MTGHQRRRANSGNDNTNQERDAILESLAEQLRQIQERLERLEAAGREAPHHEDVDRDAEDHGHHGHHRGQHDYNSEEVDGINPFANQQDDSSDDDIHSQISIDHHGNNFHIRVDIPEYEERYDPDDFIDWMNTTEHVFCLQEDP